MKSNRLWGFFGLWFSPLYLDCFFLVPYSKKERLDDTEHRTGITLVTVVMFRNVLLAHKEATQYEPR